MRQINNLKIQVAGQVNIGVSPPEETEQPEINQLAVSPGYADGVPVDENGRPILQALPEHDQDIPVETFDEPDIKLGYPSRPKL